MASINWMKATTQKAGALKKHLGQTERETGNHSNEHIDKKLTYQNYAIGCDDYSEALGRMKARTREVDGIIPPLRVRKDRVTCCFLELPCPRELTEQGKSDDFFQKAHGIYREFFGKENVHGTFVHKDEVHEYVGKDNVVHLSCEHAHTLISAFTKEKGINGKAFETKSRIKALNDIMDEMCVKEFGIHLNTSETPERKSVEVLKQESEAREELERLNKCISELQQAEQKSRNRFSKADKKAIEAENRLGIVQKQVNAAEQKVATAKQKLQEINAQYDIASRGLKEVLDKKARASEIKRSIFDKDIQSYHASMLDSTRAIGLEAYNELTKANKMMQQAVEIQARAERKEQSIGPLYQKVDAAHRQAMQEKEKLEELRKQQEKFIKEQARKEIAGIMQGVPSKERDRMRLYMDKIRFQDGTTALEHFEKQEQKLQKRLKRDLDR